MISATGKLTYGTIMEGTQTAFAMCVVRVWKWKVQKAALPCSLVNQADLNGGIPERHCPFLPYYTKAS